MEKKKLMSLFALGCGALLLVGCGTDSKKDDDDDKEKEKEKEKVQEVVDTKQTIKCTSEMNEDGMTMIAENVFVYDKEEKKLVSGSMEMKMDMSEEYNKLSDEEKKETEDLMNQMFGSMCSSFEGEGFSNCKSSFKNGKFELSTGYDMSKLEKTTDGDVKVEMTPEEIKEYFEDTDDTTCTIE